MQNKRIDSLNQFLIDTLKCTTFFDVSIIHSANEKIL